MAKGIDEGRAIDIVFTDFSKTFDKDLHGRLVCKVGSHGIQDELPSWIQNWSCGRRLGWYLSGCISNSMPVTSGVLQGSVCSGACLHTTVVFVI